MSQNRGFPVLPQGSRLKTASCVLDCPRTAKEPYGQQKERADKPKNPVNGNTQDPQRQREQPHDGIEHESHQRDGPAQDEQDTPEKESGHGNLIPSDGKVIPRKPDHSASRA